jgi:hypothetical protein
MCIGRRNREGDALVRADLPTEDRPVVGVFGGALDEPLGIADAFGGDQDSLRVHAG